MYQSAELQEVLETSHTIDSGQAVWLEWNLNQSYNISKVGNYRYRPGSTDPSYGAITSTYDSLDAGNYYTGATDSDVVVNAGFEDDNTPVLFIAEKKKMNLLYSLEDCFKQNRPRSGINKLLYLGTTNQYIDGLTSGYSASVNVARRPRYYMASRYDDFRYWTSYRTEVVDGNTDEFGIARNESTGSVNPSYYIYDAAPFVVYNDAVPANRIAVKMQTNVGEVDNGPFRIGNNTNVPDPLYGLSNRTVPRQWSIQILNASNQWVEAKSFSESETRTDGSPIIGSDGQVELEYGLVIPELYEDVFTYAGEISSLSMRPDLAPYGYAYLYKTSDTDRGILYVSDGGTWQSFTPSYTWSLAGTSVTKNTKVVKSLVNPDYYLDGSTKIFREFQFIHGLRIVVSTMNKVNCTFDLIELSPRLVADVSNKVISFSITKTLADLGTYSLPTGAVLAATGNIAMFDDELAFNENNVYDPDTNTGSIISQYSNGRMKFLFYEIVKNIGGFDYYLPIKTMYSDRIPQTSDSNALISIDLRDLFFLLESKKSPELLLTNVSLSYAITVLLDSIGFSNYTFKRVLDEDELIIPYFFVGPDQNVAETLQQLAISSQSAIFFDEYNDLIVMSKNYILPSATARPTDLILYGQETVVGPDTKLPNIVGISSQEKRTFNGGEINYTTRYIQRSFGSIAQAPYTEEYKEYIYKPVLLWEVAGQEMVRTQNEAAQQASGYSLSAMPIKTTLTSDVPDYVGGEIINNIIDFGESIYWLGNYSGYFYANGEVIRYDAVEYSVAGVGNVWITNNQEYQSYFSRLRFNGKMYPTGRVRIYTNIQGGVVKEHGRGQFDTEIVEHRSGITQDSPWITNVRGQIQNAKDYLFNTNATLAYPADTGIDAAGLEKIIGGNTYQAQTYADRSTRNGIIKNFMANKVITDAEINEASSAFSGSVQTSALIFNGPTVPTDIDPVDFVTYAYNPLDKPYKHFGTRMRIIGRIESGTNKDQTAIGAFDIYSADISSTDPEKQVSITGGSGGLCFGVNKDTNIGYYFEIAALSQGNVSNYTNNSNVAVYNVVKDPQATITSDAVTVSLDSQHDFEVGVNVIISGMIDDNNKTNSSTPINGEVKVTAISTDRKQFQYTITPPTSTTASITAVSGDGTTVTYTASNTFKAGQKVTITGIGTAAYNLSNVIIDSATATQFTVLNSATGATGTGTATYVPLTTTSSQGGTVRRVLDSNTLISDVFFYKVVSGPNIADIIKKQRTGTTATLTTLRPHSLVVGESVTVDIQDSVFDGVYQITAVTEKTISYTTAASGTVSLTDVDPIGFVSGQNQLAIPEILWRGFTEILVDDGKFTSQARLTAAEKTTVYDLSAEYLDIGSTRQFYLYLNDKQIAVVNDTDPLPLYNNIGLFVRGSSRIMFENVFALADNFSQNNAKTLQLPISKIFGDNLISETDAIKKYAISGIVQNTYLSGISSQSSPEYVVYYEEFGTIMREAAYFNIRYDRAYPALYAQLADTINRVRGYTVSGFYAGSYGAEFLIFNAIDKNLNLDDTSGNYLRILGIAFTQNTTHSLKVDDFFRKNSNFVNALYSGETNSEEYQQLYTDIQNSRNKYGRNDFTIDAQYIQTDAAAEEMMDWTIRRVLYPRKTVGVYTFATPHIQLGDIVQIEYKDDNNVPIVAPSTQRFVVYNIEVQKSSGDSTMTVFLAEV